MTTSMRTGALAALGLCSLLACGVHEGQKERQRWSAAKGEAPARKYRSVITTPDERLGMATTRRNIRGERARVPCATCHEHVKLAAPKRGKARARRFHKAQAIVHGDLTCRSCHLAPRFERFRLSSGQTLPYAEVMTLCGQCHSRQLKDYRHGAHGGMRGYWDLDRGPRARNHCLDCHNPHHPAIPKVMPAPLPRNRFQGAEGGKE